MLILRGKSFALSAGGRGKPANRFYACLGARSGKMSLGKCRHLWPNQTGGDAVCRLADGVLRPFAWRFAVFCCVKGGISGGGKHVFGARKRCFAAADMVFSGGKYRQKNVKTSYFIAQNAAMRRNARNVRQLRLHTIFARICARRPFIFQRRPSHASRKFNV